MKYSTGADKSKLDLRTFSYKPAKANKRGGEKYSKKHVDDQHRVGICTSISLTMNAHKATGVKYSADFQYLIQKKFIDGNWNEGSSIFSACKAAHKYGLLPYKDFKKYIDEDDRKLTYRQYIKKLQAIPNEDIIKLFKKTTKIEGYAKVPASYRNLANGIDENGSGLLVRFAIGKEWWTKPVQPIRRPKVVISGHAVNSVVYDKNEFILVNSWGTNWEDNGHAKHLFDHYRPTEAYAVFYEKIPEEVNLKTPLHTVIRVLKALKRLGITKS